MKKLITIAIIGSLLILAMALFSCVTVQPVPDTRPKNNYYQLARQAEQLTNQRP